MRLVAVALLASAAATCGGAPAQPGPCDSAPTSALPFCDVALPFAQRIEDLLGRLPLSSKIALLGNKAGGVEGLNIAPYQWWSEALHGVAKSPGVNFTAPTPFATSFPQVINTGATFNRTLPGAIGAAVATEARAFANAGNAGLTFWAPNINLVRDPRWGRGQETPGEDPYLTANYAREYVRGMQEGEDPRYLKVSSCCKHYAAYDLENWGGVDRHHFDARVSAQDMADTYLPPFQTCVADGRASSVMCSYNEVNGVPSCADAWLLTTVLREQWRFDGYVTSDCQAIADVLYTHNYTASADDTCAVTLQAGTDTDCGSFLQAKAAHAVASGALPQAAIDDALRRLFRVQMRLGMFDPAAAQPYARISPDAVDTPPHRELALQAARQSMVLLKNEARVLPLTATPARVAVIGPNGNMTVGMLGNYFGYPSQLASPLEALRGEWPHAAFTFEPGCANTTCEVADTTAAAAAAAAADLTLLFVGLDQSVEREGVDRTSIALPGRQQQLIDAVAAASKVPVVVVVLAGSSLDLRALRDSARVGALLWAGYPGQAGGQAIADVLVGRFNPGGRLPITQYPAEYASAVSMLDMNMRPQASGNPGRTYRFYSGPVAYPFGYGLSYTTFAYSVPSPPTVDLRRAQAALDAVEQAAARAVAAAAGSPGKPQQAGLRAGATPPAPAKPFAAARSLAHARAVATAPSLLSSAVVGGATVTVTNTGPVAGDDAVLVFAAPGNDSLSAEAAASAPIKWLVGFERVSLQPGESRTLSFDLRLAHVAVARADGTRELLRPPFQLTFGVGESAVAVAVVGE